MMREVFIRRKQATNNVSTLVRCQVLSAKGDMLRIVPEGSRKPVEIKASEVIQANKLSGMHNKQTLVPKMYPTSPGAMHNLLPKS